MNRALLPVHGLSREMTLSVPLTQKYRAMFAILAIVYNTEVTNYVTVMNKHMIPHHILIQGDPQRTRLQRRLYSLYSHLYDCTDCTEFMSVSLYLGFSAT